MRDRTVHAEYQDMEIVRYDRAGRWYLEPTDTELRRQSVSVGVAVESARWGIENAGGVWHKGRYGGSRFDHLMASKESA